MQFLCIVGTDHSHLKDSLMTQVLTSGITGTLEKCAEDKVFKKRTYLFWKVDTAPWCQRMHVAATFPNES